MLLRIRRLSSDSLHSGYKVLVLETFQLQSIHVLVVYIQELFSSSYMPIAALRGERCADRQGHVSFDEGVEQKANFLFVAGTYEARKSYILSSTLLGRVGNGMRLVTMQQPS